MLKQKQFENTWEVNINKKSINQSSHFCSGAFTHSSLEIFGKVPVLEIIISTHTQEVFPSTSLDESSIEFEFETEHNLY